MFKVKFLTATTAGVLMTMNGVQGQSCSTAEVGVSLFDCPLPSWSSASNPTTAASPMTLDFVVVDWELPFIDPDTFEPLGDGDSWTMRTKTYQVGGVAASVPPPTLIWEKGAKVFMSMTNNLHLSPEGTGAAIIDEDNMDAFYYNTNIHTHGLHISSAEDDPTVDIFPGETHVYEFNVPANHAGGLHWYHPHTHPLGEYFMGGGAFGALRIEDSTTGNEIPSEIVALPNIDLVINKFYPAKLQDISDGYVGTFDFINGEFPRQDIADETFSITYDTTKESTVKLTDSTTFYTTVNGYVLPKLDLVSGQWYRIGMVHVGGEGSDALPGSGKYWVGKNKFVDEASGATCQVKLIAKDGVYLRESRDMDFTSQRMWLHPASRNEFMLRCDLSSGVTSDETMALIMDAPPANNVATPVYTLPVVTFSITTGTPSTTALDGSFQTQACLPSYLPEMRGDDVEITAMAPYLEKYADDIDIQNSIRDNTRTTYYNETSKTMDFEISPFSFNGAFFTGYSLDVAQKNVTLFELNNVYQLRLIHGTHPLHVHINHMQLQENVVDVSGYHLAGDYVDTFETACPENGDNCVGGGVRDEAEHVVMRTYIERFTGRVLVHCHIMDHADSGAIGEAFILPNGEEYVERSWTDDCSATVNIVSA